MRTLLLLAAALTVLSACGRRAPLDVPPPPPERDATQSGVSDPA